jgi:hypothetical protein
VLERLEGVLQATHSAPRLVLARHPVKDRYDAFWLVRGRLVDWGALPSHEELVERTQQALSRPPGRTVVPVDEVDEIRIVASWVADGELPELPLDPAPSAPALLRFVASAIGEVQAQDAPGSAGDPERPAARVKSHA